jgi:hypothetical protein
VHMYYMRGPAAATITYFYSPTISCVIIFW